MLDSESDTAASNKTTTRINDTFLHFSSQTAKIDFLDEIASSNPLLILRSAAGPFSHLAALFIDDHDSLYDDEVHCYFTKWGSKRIK